MFVYSCCVEFTPEVYQLIPFLNEIGYQHAFELGGRGNYLVTVPDLDGVPCYYSTDCIPVSDYMVDCGDNHFLFADVVAIRDDSDNHQVFILDRGCVFEDGKFLFTGDKIVSLMDKLPKSYKAHKASLEELLNFYC